ncbi:hypothetical protein SAMN06265365_1606 [Tistlia consotensis]|uniref:Uncharacterized protein n=1 Tax=Tistlia consotensis USBA 355 TaxID=560819 RepID=A0A1Y6CSD6_9PROT|nr:hypothetical protein [Tistlia consotensis]SMF85529.1 hypothetical protein SAMN05428998_1654 [Tistlia consotensis USBA 355]SNS38797.1 hypothetical protein SAMN06265365_1606 [Tistlia consotensis]
MDFLRLLDRIELVAVPEAPSQAPASHDIDQQLRRWLNEAIERSPLDRAEIAEAMTALAGRPVTKPMLDTWTGSARPNRMPADLLPAFCIAAGTNHVMERLAADIGARLSDTQEARLARLGQWALLIAYGQDEQRRIASSLPPLPLLQEAAR